MKKFFAAFLFVLVFSLNGFSQLSSSEKMCYIKAVFVDSASGKPLAKSFDLTKPIPTILIKDKYTCNCQIEEYTFLVVRGKRPVQSLRYTGTAYLPLASLVAKYVQPGDRIMIEVNNAASGGKKCLQLSNDSPVFSAGFYEGAAK